jgi:hypothetical protein
MLKTNGVTSLFDGRDFKLLKHKALLFDTIYLSELRSEGGNLNGFPDNIRADIEYLQERGVVAPAPDPSHSWLAVNNNDSIRHLEGICDDPACEDRKVIEALIDVSGHFFSCTTVSTRALPWLLKNLLNLWTKLENRTTVGVATTISAAMHDGPAWRMHRPTLPVHPPPTSWESISACRRDDLGDR